MLINIFRGVEGILCSIFQPVCPPRFFPPFICPPFDENAAIRRRLQLFLNQMVTVETTSGDVSGQVTAVGFDFLELQSAGEIILIPFESILFVSLQEGSV
ncbi:DUF2642 domain-containing protein [Paludifilum halophilum]|uniref:DUF2642 domain-containing protein n=1 Tax=Paludifilum halophilum TaxID=1642702 RepID=A0A235BBM8_9BACL|nr:DUF2642 domain-containing protein [Paludifilum halophilum]OYD09676.1 hypothetical protein CHM34_01330 [Paludifilum halophilum]